LGIENIWIDSFCIIQDDQLNWREQAAHMATIYQNSYITLVATASLNSEAGCFWDSDASYERTFSVEHVFSQSKGQ
jgi:Heterokaryon incompatibility protein (HET)